LEANIIMPKRLRVLLYAVNGLGLGHLTRLLAIAKNIILLNPDSDLLFISSSDGDNLLSKEGIPYIHLPSKMVASQSETLTSRKMGRLYSSIVNSIFDIYQPHILLVDTMVTGSFHDLLNILRFGNCLKVFVHRSRKIESYQQSAIQAQRFYDLVIAPHYQKTEIIPMPVGFDVPLYWAGNIMLINKEQAHPREKVREELSVSENQTLVFVSLGGGGDESNLQTLQSVLTLLRPYENIKILFAEGLLSENTVLYNWLADHPDINSQLVKTHVYPIAQYLKGIDLAISAAGYNSFHELLYFGVPTIFVPKPRGYDDQLMRVKQAVLKGACLLCEEDDYFEENFKSNLEKLFSEKERLMLRDLAMKFVPQNHAQEAAEVILDSWKDSLLSKE
jgi:UDP-N-acetylglucosamine--N-acetylmuramyl-(pentapeptide) pyrophosphoryl-undecaprenol N-acetylglucosamine transferase